MLGESNRRHDVRSRAMNRPSKKSALNSATVLVAMLIGCAMPVSAQNAPAPEGLAGGPNPKAVMMYNLGITAYKQGSTDAAVIFFKRACDIDPNLADAQYNLAVIYQSQRRYKEAIPRFEEVLRIKPNDPDAHFQLGSILQESGRYPESRQHFSAIAPNSSHFPESQRRMTQMNNGSPPETAINGAAPYAAPPSPYAQPIGQQPYQANTPAQPYAAPQSSMTPLPSQSPVSDVPATDTPDGRLATPPAISEGAPTAPATPPNPVPLMPNTSLRVIATGFSAPAGLAFDRTGNLYVANYLTNSIDRIAPDGTKAQFSSGSTLRGPIGLVTDDIGNVYVANYNGGTVAKINPAGVPTVIAQGFKKPYYLTLDRDGNLYVSQQEDNSIVRITLPRPAAALKTP
jgi:hypothetical protein